MQQQLHKFAGKFTVAACCVALFFSCRKDKLSTDGNGNGGGGNGNGSTALSAEDSLKYLMYNIMQVSYADGGRNKSQGLPTYFWYNSVPAINPLDSKYSSADVLLSTMAQYAINPATKRPYDHYSFLDRTGSLTNKLLNGISAATTVAATSGDVGLDYGAAWDADNQKVRFFVLYADKNSPAGKVGVTRGYEIISINGNSKFDTTATFLNQAYNAILNSANVTLGFKRPDGSTFTSNLAAGTYNVNPVAFDSVLTMGTKKVGYFVLYTYSSVTNSSGDPTNTKTAIDEAFTKFKAAGINNLIVDLRYNGGGAVSTAEYLDNLIAPATAKGKVMYNYQYNDKLQAVATSIDLETVVNFSNSDPGGLTLENVFFVTSRNTASASELTLNNLRPYMTVQLVGDTTYGKPVGFIDFNISMYDSTHTKKYLADLYAINFATTNASGSGGYYTGIAPQALARDLINVPWGNIVYDENLNMINNYLKGNGYSITKTARTESLMPSLSAIKSATKMAGFNGMVDYRLSKQIQQALK
ncbi:Peptidase family S41 [Chitinophaga jiangningensis]|uniref:Peptidase family S41 n=1 Tax=Chitinophaga jiangningensis TaxID=1419482 RepID=A0A1M7MSD9_9BACT|nr:S41 family peptidase [Chitinophaga jiangningensis]SHM93925.1 Peptidase family S41 [Chitinophaga jiangningensis]